MRQIDYNSPFKFTFEDPDYSLIEITKKIGEQVGRELDDMTWRAIRRCNVEVDEEELRRALAYDRDQYEAGYKCGFMNGMEEAQRWIPVTERLPDTVKIERTGTEYSEAVNVLTSGRKVITAIFDGTDFIGDAEFWEAEDEVITHWTPVLLPLPKAPKDGDT